MEEVQETQSLSIQALERALSNEHVSSLTDKVTALVLNALSEGSDLEQTSIDLPVSEALENPRVVRQLVEAKKLLPILKAIKESKATVHKIASLYLEENDFIAVLNAAPNLKSVTINKHFIKWDQLNSLLNKETLEDLKLDCANPNNLDFLTNCPMLSVFEVERVNISKPEHWDVLSRIDALRVFKVSRSNFNKLEILKDLKHLKGLSIHKSGIKNWKALAELRSLEILHFAESTFSDTTLLQEMTQLKRLEISDCTITDWSGLTKLTSVQLLRITRCKFLDSSVLKEMTQLRNLSLVSSVDSNSRFLETSFLENMDELRILDLYENSILDWSGLFKVRSLEKANLRSTSFDELSSLAKCKELAELNISDTKVDLSNLPVWPRLQRLFAVGCECSDNGKQLQKLGKTVVHLRLDQLTGVTDWSFLREMTALEFLSLNGTNIDDLSHLNACKKLRNLGIQNCTALKSLKPLASLPCLRQVTTFCLPDTVDTSPIAKILHLNGEL